MSAKKKEKIRIEREQRSGGSDLQKWYKNRQRYLTGSCMRCGARYDKNVLKYATMSICHIFPKRGNMFPSVATHPLNFWEASPFCGCHNWFDNFASWDEKLNDAAIGDVIFDRMVMVEPDIAQNERRNLPQSFIDHLNKTSFFI